MRQVKRLFYMVLLNIIISAITVVVVLQLWENNHPPLSVNGTPAVIVVTPTQSVILPLLTNNLNPDEMSPVNTSVLITGTLQIAPTIEMLTYEIKEGDTLGALAIQFNVSVADMLTVNDLSDPDSLYVGQIIYIPTAPLPKATSTSIPPTMVASPTRRPSATITHGPTPTATQTQIGREPQVVIDTVIGAGVLENERVVLHRTGDGELSLAGWRLEDGMGKVYTFPQLTLYKGGAINLNTRTGEDTPVNLFWGLTSPIWNPGETVFLYDSLNELRASYTIP